MPQIKVLFFDCDNTLVLSEDLAFEACADLTNEILTRHNIDDRYTSEQLLIEFLGQNFRGMMAALQTKYNLTLTTAEIEAYVQREEDFVIAKLQRRARATDGSTEVIEKLATDKQHTLAVASSSAIRRIRAALEKAGHDKFFPPNNVFSAVSSLPRPATKPSPDVYLFAMDKLGVKPEECVTVEDSRSGALAAVRAGIPCIAYVGAYPTKWKQEQVAKTLMDVGCRCVMKEWNEYFECVKMIEDEVEAEEGVKPQ